MYRAQQLQLVNAELRAAIAELGRQNEQLRLMGSELEVGRELRRSQELLQAIVDGTAAEFYVQDGDGRFLLVNRRFESRLGRSREEIVGHHDEEPTCRRCPSALIATTCGRSGRRANPSLEGWALPRVWGPREMLAARPRCAHGLVRKTRR